MSEKIINGECLEELKKMEENSVDTIITDPPYGLSFMGKKWDYDVPSVEIWEECLRVLKPGGTALIFAGSRTQHRMAVNVEDAGFILKDTIMWVYGSGFPKATDISKQIDKKFGRVRTKGIMTKGMGKQNPQWNGKENGRSKDFFKPEYFKGEPATPEAELWEGWKSHALKPAYEPIIVAMKPNDKTYANNALVHGVSGLNIDGGRITINDLTPEEIKRKYTGVNSGNNVLGLGMKETKMVDESALKGRFPANIILDEEAGAMLDEQSDKASRFFYCAKSSKSERNAGCEGLEEKQKYYKDGRGNSHEVFTDGDEAWKKKNPCLPTKNYHPTVKPLKLMEYLCTLTKTPTGGIVLDPFAGSGTTGVACKNVGRDYILIEREAEYCEIIKARLGNKTITQEELF